MMLVFLSLLSFLGYNLTNKRPFVHNFETKLDQKIKPIKIFVIPYLGLFPYLILAYLSLQGSLRTNFLLSISICNVAAAIFWYFIPNGVSRPPLEKKDLFSKIINYIYQHDGDTNGFPSGHVFLSAIVSHFMILQQPKLMWAHLIAWGFISLSTVFTKQHYLVDILGGIIFAISSIFLSSLFS